MPTLDDAIAHADALRLTLEAEVGRARDERRRLASLDAEALFAGASARAAFNAEVARREQALATALARAASALGLPEVTLAHFAACRPDEAAALADELAEIRSLAAALAELDRLNLAVAGRALACVQSYLTALAPRPTAYDRRGARPGAAEPRARFSSKA